MNYKILLEASGSLTSSYLIKAVKEAKQLVVASDIAECAGFHTADDFILMPKCTDSNLWKKMESLIVKKKINVVIPSFDETLLDWAERKDYFAKKNIHIIISDAESLKICQDKWNTYNFFKNNGIPTPATSLKYEYPLLKPRLGRGGKGILINHPDKKISMNGIISQELLTGEEYTIDVFCDFNHLPVYIIPRKRLQVKDGKSTNGITVNEPEISKWVKKICKAANFIGPINIQCFVNKSGEIKFTEINPRVAGGMALGFTASENWINLIVKNTIEKKAIKVKPVKFGLKMFRSYDEIFVS